MTNRWKAMPVALVAGFTTLFFIYTRYLRNGLGYSVLLAGLAITPFALGSAALADVTVARRAARQASARSARPSDGRRTDRALLP